MNLHDFLEDCASPLNTPQALGQCLRHMVEAGLEQLPLPGSGLTLQRWQQLALVAGHDLGLCKVYEGHTDALATLRELGETVYDIGVIAPQGDGAQVVVA